jgi:ATP-binding cassette subfamily C (CFTR/MRP) protein 1
LITVLATVQGFVQFTTHPTSITDIRFWTTILEVISLGVIFTIHHMEHERLRVPSGVVLVYWLLFNITSAIRARTMFIRHDGEYKNSFGLMFATFALSIVIFVLETFVPKKQSPYMAVGHDKEYPSEYSNIFAQLSFSWLTPLMKHGWKSYITEDDLWDLPKQNTTKESGDTFSRNWIEETHKPSPSVWKALFKSFGGSYLSYVPLKLFSDALGYAQPQLLRMLIGFVESYQTDEPEPPVKGFAIALAMFCVSLTQSVGNNQFMNSVFELGLRVKAGLTSVIYKKSLRLSNEARSGTSTGDIVNYMVVDTQRVSDLSRQGFQLWSAPFQITLCMISLYQLLGWVGFAGVAVMGIMIPVNMVIAREQKRLQKVQMKNKDARIRCTTEILVNIKSIKLYSWSIAFAEKLGLIRGRELKTLRRIGITQAASRFTWNSTPFFVAFSTFTLFVLVQDTTLTVDLVFPALTLFNMLTQPLTQLPNVISALVESAVAINRLRAFFVAPELQEDAVRRLPAAKKYGQRTVHVSGASFSWEGATSNKILTDIDFAARKGQLNCIVGRVGSGKSSLLHGVLGDLYKLSGEVTVRGRIAFVAQNAWIMNASVRENILFGNRFNPQLYEKTIKACALSEDLSILPDGDLTEVGEKGISLSGGQKARVQLARAVYSQADIYLLDDVLSAVDQHVGRHIINEVLGSKGMLRDKTRILATNSIPVLREANYISMIKAGKITEQGYYQELMMKGGETADLIKTLKSDDSNKELITTASSSTSTTPTNPTSGMDIDYKESDSEMEVDSDDDLDVYPAGTLPEKEFGIHDNSSTSTLTRVSLSSIGRPDKNDEEMALIPSRPRGQTKEISQKGKVKWSVYGAYAKACNPKAIVVWLLTVVAVQALNVSASVWLKNWSEGNEKSGTNGNIGKNVGIYFALGISASFMIAIQTIFMWVFCAIQASRHLHDRMAHAIFRSPMSFFETTPVGRILNRFSADMFRVDEAIGKSFSEFFTMLARAVFTLVVIIFTVPVFIVVLIPLGTLYLYIQRFYLRTNRELKRLESVSRSPIYAHFGETLSGLSTIRAYAQNDRWSGENENRVDANLRAFFPAVHANRWLGIRLEFIGALVVFFSASLSIWSVISNGPKGPSSGMIGLAMSYALQITQALNWLVRISVEVETNVVSVERVLDYTTNLDQEAPDIVPENRPTASWPAKGAVEFDQYSMRYREGLKLVLKDIALSFKGGEKIGVVGRTGAGKSSLTLALFRIVEAAQGHISIDDINTSSIGLEDLRSRLAIIPQDAALFEGTVRDNLDPTGHKSDEELWSALGKSTLHFNSSKEISNSHSECPTRQPHPHYGRRP